jgi:tRNA pseudouridine32 synthase/23S rRNA pseudouridine746 synthase
MTSLTQPIEFHITVEHADSNAVQLLHEASGLTKQRVKAAMNNGSVWITHAQNNQRLRRVKRALQPGDELHLYYDEKIQAEKPPEPALIEDAGGYSVWRKPFGMRSQGSKWGDHCTIMRWAEQHLQPERTAYPVHRLDMAANGLIIVAHSKSVAAALSELFRERRIDKHYQAVVHGDLSQQTTPLRVETPIDTKVACSEVSFLAYDKDSQRSLVEVRIETGRKHQIRRHLAESGLPIVGDRLYGSGENDDADLQLTAYKLAFHCPVNDRQVEYVLPSRWLPALH